MQIKIYLAVLFVFSTNFAFANDFGLSLSKKSLSLEYWGETNQSNPISSYLKLILDFAEYEDGSMVSVCSDGSISGSFGPGTCSSHGGVSGTKRAEFHRFAFGGGPEIRLTEILSFHVGLIWSIYSSDIDIGDEQKLDFSKFGANLGLGLDPFKNSKVKISFSYESEPNNSYIGIRFPI